MTFWRGVCVCFGVVPEWVWTRGGRNRGPVWETVHSAAGTPAQRRFLATVQSGSRPTAIEANWNSVNQEDDYLCRDFLRSMEQYPWVYFSIACRYSPRKLYFHGTIYTCNHVHYCVCSCVWVWLWIYCANLLSQFSQSGWEKIIKHVCDNGCMFAILSPLLHTF